jgi:hypothetical protein
MNMRDACRYAEGRLQEWGDWAARHLGAYSGLPTETPYLARGGRSEPCSRVPIPDEPRRSAQVSRIVAKLPPHIYNAAVMNYVLNVDNDGKRWLPEEKARAFRISLRTFRHRVSVARRAVALAVY